MKPNLIVIGASAGGVEALSYLLEEIPEDLNVAIFIVLHMNPAEKSMLGHILAAKSNLPVTTVTEKIIYKARNIYVCPPDRHIMIDQENVFISIGPKINGFRPSIEPLFTSAAHSGKDRVIAILLTGLLYDGILGLTSVKRYGGCTIVQDPNEAKFADLPLNALKSGYVDYSLSIKAMARKITELLSERSQHQTNNLDETHAEIPIEEVLTQSAAKGMQMTADLLNKSSNLTDLTCPECSGSMWEINQDNVPHYRCRIGHQYNINNIEDMHSRILENLLWAAVRALEESGSIALRLADQFEKSQLNAGLAVYREKAKTAYENANKLRGLITKVVENT